MVIFKDLQNQLDPNCYTSNRGGHNVLALVVHNTSGPNDFNNWGQTEAQAVQLSNNAADYLAGNTRQVSVHWLIGGENSGAQIYKIVPESMTAYHAGGDPEAYSHWTNPDDGREYRSYELNQVSIGIEMFGQPTDVVGPKQLAAARLLVADIVSRYPILKRPGHILSHMELEADRTDGPNWRDFARKVAIGGAVIVPPPATTPTSDPWAGVGTGVKAIMTANGYVPAGPESYEHDAGTGKATMSRTYGSNPKTGKNGVAIWSADSGITHLYEAIV